MKILLMLLSFCLPAGAGELSLTLKQAEQGALASSGQYKAAEAAAEAAARAAGAAGSALYPRVALEGALKYNEVVTEIKLGPVSRPMGDNWNYSIGPSAYYTLFDGGALRGSRDAALKNAQARRAEAVQARRQALLAARAAYFRMQLALEKVYLIGENLQLACRQQKDVDLGVKAGSRSRLDGLRARQEVTARRRDLLRARNELSAALRDLSYAAGLELPPDSALPFDARMAGRDYAGASLGGLALKAEPYEAMQAALAPAAGRGPGKELPSVAALRASAGAYAAAASAQKAERLPRLALNARSSIDYPNGPNIYSFMQNSAGLTLSLPLFEKDRTSEKERENLAAARASLERGADAERSAARDFAEARDAYSALGEEQSINIEAVDDAAEAARLAYDSYKAGGGTWLEVESANLKELQARTTLATVNAEMLLKLAVMDSLSDEEKI